MNSLIEILYFFSNTLLVPVIVVLMGFSAWSMLEIGGFIREARERYSKSSEWNSYLSNIYNQTDRSRKSMLMFFFQQNSYWGLIGLFSSRGSKIYHSELDLSKLVIDLELEAANNLARLTLGVRVGPMLGLMGTLIPLGPALIGFSTGNIEEMASQLVVAFSTTVLGLFVSGICYGIWLTRRQWYARDLAEIEYIYQSVAAATVFEKGD